jgi:uncharacterized cupin superfamily protein
MSEVPEAALEQGDGGLVPSGPGWFVVNAREAQWVFSDELGSAVLFESREHRFPQVGINIQVLKPGEPNCMYHGENAQEDFLVIAGECLVLIEGQERRLRQWDFVHCPPWTQHVFVGTGDGPCAILMIGARVDDEELVYPRSELALRHGAGVEQETTSGKEAYARFSELQPGPYRDGALPGD